MRATAYSTVNGKRSEASCSSFSDPSIPLFSGCNNHAPERHWGIRASLRKLCCHFSHVKSPRRCGTLLRKVPRWAYPIFFIAAALAAICVVNLVAMANGDHHLIAEQEERAEWRAWEASLAVVVAHAAPLTVLDGSQLRAQEAGLGSAALVRRTQLPSWTLHVVEAECAECLDSAMHAAAVRRQMAGAPAAEKRGATVFATPSAPLGLAGPMLLAMASVTDDVAVGAELARWSWVPRSYAMRRQFAGASPAGLRGGTSPYLVVMGIPSTDQPVRSSLRDAQRDTWLAYTEVARSGNDFRGALLPLYIFAAAERVQLQGVTDVSPLLPTVAEYEAASAMQLRRGGAAETAVRSYSERRVELIPGAGTVGAGDARLAESPCLKIVLQRVSPDADTGDTWLSQLASALDLPIMPAAVAPAEFICGASTALWQEALAHRNALWVDMVTDRRPTSDKRVGESGNWGLPVEVGMSQKLILWLEYAYHAFPDVPYIMKGDDDTYLKVPQFLRDIRYIRGGFRDDRMEAPLGQRDPVGINETEDCLYWGSRWRSIEFDGFPYHEGSGYMLHRRIVQAITEETNRTNAYMLYLAARPFKERLTDTYIRSIMHIEDAFMGRMILEKRRRLREICPLRRGSYVEEPKRRQCDLYNQYHHNVTWASLLLHHVSPFDQHYLHYFFQHEHEVAAQAGGYNATAEEAANRAAAQWMASHVSSSLYGSNRTVPLHWTHPVKDISSFTAAQDKVRVYGFKYQRQSLDALDVAYVSLVP